MIDISMVSTRVEIGGHLGLYVGSDPTPRDTQKCRVAFGNFPGQTWLQFWAWSSTRFGALIIALLVSVD